jgi:hypothetical protein
MKSKLLLSIVFFFVGISLGPQAKSTPAVPPPEGGVEIGFFYSSLSPYGQWIETGPGFRVWRPAGINRDWRPYMLGRWVWSDCGWYWMSGEPFGWVVYHYGRWYYDDYYGWVWVPDDVWGPAWVEWRYDNDYIGWAPLPPYATFRIGVGLRYTTHWVAPVHYWSFVRYNNFGKTIRYRDLASPTHARRLIGVTRSGSSFEVENGRIIDRGVDRTFIERRSGARFPRAEVQNAQGRTGERLVRSSGNNRGERIEIYRPSQEQLLRGSERFEARRGDRPLSIDMNKIERYRQAPPQAPPGNAIRREEARSREPQREERRREAKPNVREQQRIDQTERRRELIERYDGGRNPSPPNVREAPRQNVAPRREAAPRQRIESPRRDGGSGREGGRRER